MKDGSHAGHEQFFATETVLTPEEKLTTADFYQFHPQVACCASHVSANLTVQKLDGAVEDRISTT